MPNQDSAASRKPSPRSISAAVAPMCGGFVVCPLAISVHAGHPAGGLQNSTVWPMSRRGTPCVPLTMYATCLQA